MGRAPRASVRTAAVKIMFALPLDERKPNKVENAQDGA
jgi:hypothetical protein